LLRPKQFLTPFLSASLGRPATLQQLRFVNFHTARACTVTLDREIEVNMTPKASLSAARRRFECHQLMHFTKKLIALGLASSG
jgi:hypothetical protein